MKFSGCAKVDKICTNSAVIGTYLNECGDCVDTWQQCGRMCQKDDKCGYWQFKSIQGQISNCKFFGEKYFVNISMNGPKMFFFLNLLHRSKNVPNVQKKLHM